MTHFKNILLIGIASFGMAAAQNNTANPIKIVGSTFLVTQVAENGKTVEKLVDGSKALPNQVLEMRQVIQNTSKNNYGKIFLNQVISNTVNYLLNQCSVPGVTVVYSTDPVKLDAKTSEWTNSKDMSFSEKPTKVSGLAEPAGGVGADITTV